MTTNETRPNVLVGYMDACPEDILREGQPERWYTIAIIFPLASSLPEGQLTKVDPLQPVADALEREGLRLRKWSSKRARQYRARFRRALPCAMAYCPMAILGASYTARDALSMIPGSLNTLDLDELTSFYERNGKQRFRVGPFVRTTKRDYFLQVTQNELAVLLVMAQVVLGTFRILLPSAEIDPPNEPLWLLWTDLLAGDTTADKRKTEFLQHVVRRMLTGADIQLRTTPNAAPHKGDLLADNVAGWLNDFLVAPTRTKAESIVRCRESIRPGVLEWKSYSLTSQDDLVNYAERQLAN
jgi:hypothetical protein